MNRTLPASMLEEFSVFIQPIVVLEQVALFRHFPLDRTQNPELLTQNFLGYSCSSRTYALRRPQQNSLSQP
jgi:hypothetical protein